MSVSEEEAKILKKIGFQIGRRRETLNMTQEYVASLLNIDRGNYTKMENGNRERRFNYSQLALLVEKLNTSFDYIFGKTNEATADVDIKNFCDEYKLTEQSLDIIKSTIYCDCSDVFNNYLSDFAVLDICIQLKGLKKINEMIVENLLFLQQLSNFKEYIFKNQNRKEIFDFLKLFENKILSIKEYNNLCIKKSNSLKVYSSLWSKNLPTLQEEETTIIKLFEAIKKSIKNSNNKSSVYETINDFTVFIKNVLSDFLSKREIIKYHLIKSISNDLDKVIPEEHGDLYYRELEEYYPNSSLFTKDEISQIKKEHVKSEKIIDIGYYHL